MDSTVIHIWSNQANGGAHDEDQLTTERWLSSEADTIVAGQEHQLAITFGAMGFQLVLDGQLAGSRADFTQGLNTNGEQLAIGANIWGRSEENPLYAKNEFSGVITDFTIYDHQRSELELTRTSDRVLLEPIELNRDLAFTDQSDEPNDVDRLFEDIRNRLFAGFESLLSFF